MIIYGIKNHPIKASHPQTAKCPMCDSIGSVSLAVSRRHIHVFWIPFIPLRKKVFVGCEACESILKPKDLNEHLKFEYNKLKYENRGPVWQFSGLILLSTIALWAYFQSAKHRKEELVFIQNPKVGDVYHYTVEKWKYSTMKVIELKNDSVFIVLNDYEINAKSKVLQLNKEENYNGAILAMHKNDVLKLYNSKEIFDLTRK